MSTEYIARRDLLIEGLNKIKGVICPKPKGAFYCIAELPVDDADNFAQWLLEEFSYEGATVMVAPAAGFYATPNTGTKTSTYCLCTESRILKKSSEVFSGSVKSLSRKNILNWT